MAAITKIQTPMMKRLSNIYIDLYVHFRNNGSDQETAYYETRYKMQEVVIDLMIELPEEIGIIGVAYEDIKRSSHNLTQKAILRYDLASCSHEVKDKYMSLTIV